MALTKTSMATMRFNDLVAAYPDMAGINASIKAEIIKFYEADSSGIINEFTANAVVPLGILVAVDPTTHNGATTGAGKVT